MFSRIRGLISCQSNTQTIAPTLSPPSSGHVSFAGIDYPLLPLNHQTPLVFQWFERNPDRFGQNEIPIINTQKNPYLNNIINAAIIKKKELSVFSLMAILARDKEKHWENWNKIIET